MEDTAISVGGSLLRERVGEGHEHFFLQRSEIINTVNGVCLSAVDWS